MTERERLSLDEVRNEMDGTGRSLRDFLDRRPGESGATLALERLETTFMLRLYATFEGLLRARIGPSVGVSEGLTNLVQRLAGEGSTHDPATAAEMPWWELFRRDRNPLMHGRTNPPALSMNITISQMQIFLTQFP